MGKDGDTLLAEVGKERGMLRAEGGANRADPGWSDRALEMFKAFLTEACIGPFLAEEAREWATFNGLPDPPDERAWGSVVRRAAFAGLILFTKYAKTKNPRAHRTPAALWVKAAPTAVSAEAPGKRTSGTQGSLLWDGPDLEEG